MEKFFRGKKRKINDEEEEGATKSGQHDDDFSAHFNANFEAADIELLKDSERCNRTLNWPALGTFVESKVVEGHFSKQSTAPLEKPFTIVDQLQLKSMLVENIGKTMLSVGEQQPALSAFQTELLGLMSSYRDIFYAERNDSNGEQIRVAYCLHALNHILKTRSRILAHNSKINQGAAATADGGGGGGALLKSGDAYRDQGLTRAKVLIVAPFRQSAYQTVNTMISLLFADVKDTGSRRINIMNYKRFKKEFGPQEDEPPVGAKKPDDYKRLFAGNIDDSFRIGLSLTKRSLKLYTDFYSSDIIIGSPLGLRLAVGAQGEAEYDHDFLSSIEVVVLDQADVFLMQNWEHLLHIMAHLHRRPRADHGVDYSRVKLWVLELWAKYYCQLVLFSGTASSSLVNAFFHQHSANWAGKVVGRPEVGPARAAINHVFIQCPQIFQRVPLPDGCTLADSADARFDFFVNSILPKFRDSLKVRTMIYVPSYFDFVRLRNYFRREDVSFNQICEYTKAGKVARARHMFYTGGRHFLLFTERYHFFNRHTIKGIRQLIFYEPPTYPHFYSELVNSMHLSNQGKKLPTDYGAMSATVLFTRFDAHSLVSLVGSRTAASLLSQSAASTDVHMFLTDNVG